MPVNVDNLTTEVVPEPEGPGSVPAGAARRPWEEAEKMREALARVKRDRGRTAAEGFDD
jgi:hypothetical protein